MEQEFVKAMSDESRYYRFMDTLRELTQTMLVRFTQIDYDREMALVATLPAKESAEGEEGGEQHQGKEVQIGVARYVVNPDGESVEFALAVGDDWQKCGVGRKLMTALIDCARSKGYRAVVGDDFGQQFQRGGRGGDSGHGFPPPKGPRDCPVARSCYADISSTMRPSILPACILSKMSLMSSRRAVAVWAWTIPAAAKSSDS